MRSVATRWVAFGVLAIALVLAGVVSYYASSAPDGLNRIAQEQGFSDTEKKHGSADGPLAGYTADDVSGERLSGGLAGVIGVVVVLALAGGLALVVRRRPADATDPEAGEHANHDEQPVP